MGGPRPFHPAGQDTRMKTSSLLRRLAPLPTLVLAALAPATAQAQTRTPVGVWDIVELVNWSPDGARSEPYGSDPNGMFVYTPEGHLILHITTNPLLPAQPRPPSQEDMALRARSAIAYYGRYTVDLGEQVIVHHIEGDLYPNRAGESQARPYRFEGDDLVLDFTSENGARFLRRLRKLEDLPSG